uniref:reticulocalbin-2 isoform X2 n=1 Tax=Solea senegalensis TaxID=28829 RepID=UPI001CD84245|nr:reticulocalbin-2 isoform X2 [Solea senegalensis]
MAPTALLVLLMLQFGLGQSSHNHLHHGGLTGQEHLSEHDMNVLLGDEDTEEIKKLSPAEQKEKLIEIVKKIDTNADNLLSVEEITLWIQHVYRKYALDDAVERFAEFDLDKDGIVTWQEYNTITHGQLVHFDDSTVMEDPEQESLRQDFVIEDVLSEYDTDKDGFISLSEFIGDVRGDDNTPSQWEIEETVRFKELYDQDKDGKLNREEQLRWVAPNSHGSAREEALHLIKEMDIDGDGQLSLDEVLKNQETFMNSEVTDYGRHLHVSHDEL